ncbi:LuxR family transcriptional regulator [Candidatus Methylospira mobilis]|uniref:LuxR family transcriptional regulator n=1 Tax=Candidatus Methylospira mobilis TaxID=1808979 RepID=A0A5Q0BGB6_9GAMM|nr:autoinducer binding domain-containing protein [Candidatus Methylospira mobilis]QFY41214.1 LuxR family transcriptional regulator [Candidatus Methylospira mobilis]WNV05560.1 autoinducer binding domain-containing protein [Candidatus Methylospira mobilis]
MRPWQDDQLHLLQSTQHEDELFQEVLALSKQLGFEHCAHGLRLPLPLCEPKIIMHNSYPAVWQTRYQDKKYLAVDPTIQHGIRTPRPLVWSDDVFRSAPEFWEEARSFGLCVGWAQSVRDGAGVCGMTTFARSAEPLTSKELREKEFEMAWLAQTIHVGMTRCLLPKIMPEIDVILSSRERAVLRWTAEGKTAGEISSILNLAERTVNFHIRNAVAKLNAPNKTSAAIRATVLGLL